MPLWMQQKFHYKIWVKFLFKNYSQAERYGL